MAIRIRKSIKIAPGIRINISKSGISTTVGGRGLTANISKKGARVTAGIPGSGVSISHLFKADGKAQAKGSRDRESWASSAVDSPAPINPVEFDRSRTRQNAGRLASEGGWGLVLLCSAVAVAIAFWFLVVL